MRIVLEVGVDGLQDGLNVLLLEDHLEHVVAEVFVLLDQLGQDQLLPGDHVLVLERAEVVGETEVELALVDVAVVLLFFLVLLGELQEACVVLGDIVGLLGVDFAGHFMSVLWVLEGVYELAVFLLYFLLVFFGAVYFGGVFVGDSAFVRTLRVLLLAVFVGVLVGVVWVSVVFVSVLLLNWFNVVLT